MKILFFLLILFTCSFSGSYAQMITTIAGNGIYGYSGDDSAATAAKIGIPEYAFADSYGNVYIAEQLPPAVRKVNTSGIIMTIAGDGLTLSGIAVNGAPATGNTLAAPEGVTADMAGNVYIADPSQHRLLRVSTAGLIYTIAGGGFSMADNIPADSAAITPIDVVVDKTGNIFITSGDQVRKIDTSGIITTIAGTGTPGYSGDGGPAIAAKLHTPRRITLDKTGNLYIVDYSNSVIRKVNTAGVISTIAGIAGDIYYGGDGGQATAATFYFPTGVDVDDFGNIYVSEQSNRVRKINGYGIITTIVGTGTAGYSGDGGLADTAEINSPTGIYVDPSGNIYIADFDNHRIRYVHAPPGLAVSPLRTNNEIIKVYPNPANQYLVVNYSEGGADGYSISNMVGQTVAKGTLDLPEAHIDITVLPEGNYILNIFKNNVPCGNTLFVKQ